MRTVIGETERVPRVAWRPLASIAGALLVLLVAFGGRYGFHRDELYFLAAGRHPAWGYPDQPPLTPIIAHLMDLIASGSVRAPTLYRNLLRPVCRTAGLLSQGP